MGLKLNPAENMLFSLLRASLQGSTDKGTDWTSASENDWKSCYRLAVRHGVMAVAWDGIQTLPHECQPPRGIRLSWGIAVQKYESRYERYCRTAAELSEFYAGHGISMVQLKGVGLSPYYPIPQHREGGDIDIYTYSADRKKLGDKEANQLADKLMEDKGINVENESEKHSNFIYKNISVENHKSFLDLGTNHIADSMNDLLLKLMNPREVMLCDGKYSVMVPSPEFNALFLSFHAGQHYCAGLRIHHLFDWACLLKKYGLPLSPEITDRKFLNFIHALTQLSNELLGTDIETPYKKNMVNEVYTQLMNPRFSGEMPKNKAAMFIYKTLRFFHNHYKTSKVFSKPLTKVLLNSITYHLRNPKTIFIDTNR